MMGCTKSVSAELQVDDLGDEKLGLPDSDSEDDQQATPSKHIKNSKYTVSAENAAPPGPDERPDNQEKEPATADTQDEMIDLLRKYKTKGARPHPRPNSLIRPTSLLVIPADEGDSLNEGDENEGDRKEIDEDLEFAGSQQVGALKSSRALV
eukprot:278140_1